MKPAIYVLPVLMVVVATASLFSCKKNNNQPQLPGTVTAESVEMHTVGGIAGLEEHYLITSTVVMKDKDGVYNAGDPYVFNIMLPKAKHAQVADVRTTVPQSLLTAPNPSHNYPHVSDQIGSWIVIHYKGITKELSMENIPASEIVYRNKINNALGILMQ